MKTIVTEKCAVYKNMAEKLVTFSFFSDLLKNK
jgi:hypothetical protein